MNKPLILDESTGDEMDALSTYCPKCGTTNIEKTGGIIGPDFDESGWFYRQGFKCKVPKCCHTWNNKIVTLRSSKNR
jgi:transposase-like protein